MTTLRPDGPVICAFADNAIAKHALRASAWLAYSLEATLLVAHAFDPMDIPGPPTAELRRRAVSAEDLVKTARERAERKLAAAVSHVRGTDVESELIEAAPVQGLLEMAARRDARLLVTGTAARVGIDRILLGSVTAELAARATCPVITVPRAAALEEPGPVLVGYDGSEHGLRAARHGAALAVQLGRDLVVVHVARRADDVLERPDRELAGELYLAASQGQLGGQPDLDVSVVHEGGDPADVLVRVAREQAAALILTGTRGRGAVSSMLLGSVSADVVAIADRPVGFVPPTVRDE